MRVPAYDRKIAAATAPIAIMQARITTLEKRFKWLCYGVVAATLIRLAVGVCHGGGLACSTR